MFLRLGRPLDLARAQNPFFWWADRARPNLALPKPSRSALQHLPIRCRLHRNPEPEARLQLWERGVQRLQQVGVLDAHRHVPQEVAEGLSEVTALAFEQIVNQCGTVGVGWTCPDSVDG